MMNTTLIESAKSFVQTTLSQAEGGHDWQHIRRVYNNAGIIAETVNCNKEVVLLAALLYDCISRIGYCSLLLLTISKTMKKSFA